MVGVTRAELADVRVRPRVRRRSRHADGRRAAARVLTLGARAPHADARRAHRTPMVVVPGRAC